MSKAFSSKAEMTAKVITFEQLSERDMKMWNTIA